VVEQVQQLQLMLHQQQELEAAEVDMVHQELNLMVLEQVEPEVVAVVVQVLKQQETQEQ
tara:strand:- start:106 stop:282 length:177 start_codon:yes stop_codon:yes gene_type:complete